MKNPLDRIAISVILALIILLVLVSVIGNQIGMTVSLVDTSVGPWGPIELEFASPASLAKVQKAVLFQPGLIGDWQVESPRQLRFFVAQPLQPNVQYSLTLQPGALGTNGEQLNRSHTFLFKTRSPEIVYLTTTPRDLWRVASDGSSRRQLTHSGIVRDFSVSRDGNQIAFSVPDQKGGVDIWLTDRDGNNTHLALDCGADRCSTPAWSPDGHQIAYTRESAGLTPGGPPGVPRPWIFNLQTAQTSSLYEDQQIIGYGTSWSPDGRRLATYDGVASGIRVLSLETRKEILLPTSSGLIGAWSPDGTRMLYPDVIQTPDGIRTIVTLANFSTGEFSTFLEGGDYDATYDVPAWSPDEKYIAVGVRPNVDSTSREVWLINPDGLSGFTISAEERVLYDQYQWDPWERRWWSGALPCRADIIPRLWFIPSIRENR
jgi:WD40 repeat protein